MIVKDSQTCWEVQKGDSLDDTVLGIVSHIDVLERGDKGIVDVNGCSSWCKSSLTLTILLVLLSLVKLYKYLTV